MHTNIILLQCCIKKCPLLNYTIYAIILYSNRMITTNIVMVKSVCSKLTKKNLPTDIKKIKKHSTV